MNLKLWVCSTLDLTQIQRITCIEYRTEKSIQKRHEKTEGWKMHQKRLWEREKWYTEKVLHTWNRSCRKRGEKKLGRSNAWEDNAIWLQSPQPNWWPSAQPRRSPGSHKASAPILSPRQWSLECPWKTPACIASGSSLTAKAVALACPKKSPGLYTFQLYPPTKVTGYMQFG